MCLYWLPIKARIEFKIATVMHAILHLRGPAYLSREQHCQIQSGRSQLCSSTTNAALV